MEEKINKVVLKSISSHQRGLGAKFWIKGLPYERCAELSWAIEYMRRDFEKPFRYLDIGTGESPLPTYLAKHSNWDITCLDRCSWVEKQNRFYESVARSGGYTRPIRVLQKDFIEAELPDDSFDIITCISVIEHFEGASDSTAARIAGRLLRPGGRLLLTTLINEPFFAEFYVKQAIYGSAFESSPVFYQRHYDLQSLSERLIRPSGLIERNRVYFGDYGTQCFEGVLQFPKAVRMLYLWATPWLAQRYLSYRSYPLSRRNMRMNTASGIILVLQKPAVAERPC